MARRNRDLSPDPQGRYRPYLGWKLGEDGTRRQHRFNLGTDKREAEKRFARIKELYDDNCRLSRKTYGRPWPCPSPRSWPRGSVRSRIPLRTPMSASSTR